MLIDETILNQISYREGNQQNIRYELKRKHAPAIYQILNKFEPQVNKTGLIKLVAREFGELIISYFLSKVKLILSKDFLLSLVERKIRLKSSLLDFYKEIRLRFDALFDRPCEYGVFDGPLGGLMPKKWRCTGCLRCWQEYPEIVKIELNKRYLEMERCLKKFNIKLTDYYTILHEAETGEELVKGMAYKGPFAGPFWDGIWLDMSEIVRPTRDGKEGREYISTTTDLGRRKDRFHPNEPPNKIFSIALPIFFDYQPENLTNEKHQIAIAKAAEESGTFAIVSMKYFEKLNRINKNLVPLIKREDYFKEKTKKVLEKSKIIELEFSEKLKEIPIPNRSEKILIARIEVKGEIINEVLKAIEQGFDVIHISFDLDGYAFDDKKLNAKMVIREIHKELIKRKIRNEISIIGSRCAVMAEHIVKAMICGLDAVGIDIALHVALQSEFKIEKEGIIMPRKVDVEWAKQRLINLLAAWHEQIIEALSAMGKRDVRRLRGDVGRAIFYEEIRKEAFEGIRCLR